jgi:alpha-beta hydrolase superfamily lysophospholipase
MHLSLVEKPAIFSFREAMTPISFGGCFGWLHAPQDRMQNDVAVVICTPLGYDALPAHSSLRLFADDLMAAGYPTLRFDYPGTGDSCDEELERVVGHCTVWCDSIHRAADWMRAATGARRIVLCGMRGSALLATQVAAAREDVAGLVLLAPVLRGRSYMRQLSIEAALQNGGETPPGDGLVFREFRFTPAAIAQIESIDLRTVKLRAGQKVALVPQQEARLVADCAQAWAAAGADVTRLDWAGLEPLLRAAIIEENTLANFSGVLSWLRQAVPPVALPPVASPPVASPAVVATTVASAELRPSGCIETPLRFGTDGRLFGILCRPAGSAVETVVLIGNGGRDPHYGAARHAVALARRLARAGIASFRLDFAGLGDSLGPPGYENVLSQMFRTNRTPDVTAAIDALELQGFSRFAMTGLCAGAYHTFVAALADRRLSLLALVNMPFFQLPGGSAVDHLVWRETSPLDLLRRIPRPESWKKLLARRREFRAVLRAQLDWVGRHVLSRAKTITQRLGLAEPRNSAQTALAGLCARGVGTLFLFSHEDHGIAAVEQELKCAGDQLARHYPGTGWKEFPEMDHDLGYVAGREPAERAMIDFIQAARATTPVAFSDHLKEAVV